MEGGSKNLDSSFVILHQFPSLAGDKYFRLGFRYFLMFPNYGRPYIFLGKSNIFWLLSFLFLLSIWKRIVAFFDIEKLWHYQDEFMATPFFVFSAFYVKILGENLQATITILYRACCYHFETSRERLGYLITQSFFESYISKETKGPTPSGKKKTKRTREQKILGEHVSISYTEIFPRKVRIKCDQDRSDAAKCCLKNNLETAKNILPNCPPAFACGIS